MVVDPAPRKPGNQPIMVKNRTIWTGDNLHILRGLADESVDLIYLDPPFNSNRNYAAPVGSEAAGAAFKDTWTLNDCDNAWHGEIAEKFPAIYRAIDASEFTYGKAMKSYLIMMAVRLIEMKRILKDTGSIYLHCDPTASHYLKVLMDAVFGRIYFRNEIVWSYPASPSSARRDFPRKNDIILRYAGEGYTFNADAVRVPYSAASMNRVKYAANASTVMGGTEIKLHEGGKIPPSVWGDIPQVYRNRKERTGYPTQKPLKLLERIIKASSNEGDVVLDPFCGCATTCVAAEKLGRKWIGIDLSAKAIKLVTARLKREVLGTLEHKGRSIIGNIIHRTDIPRRAGALKDYRDSDHKKFLYGQQEGRCNGCKVMFPYRNMTVDHIVARNRGGDNHPDNLQLLCGACNSRKGSGTQEELLVKLKEEGI